MTTNNDNRPVTMGDWMITLLILAIPIVNIFMVFYWAFTTSTNPSKRAYCQAILMFFLIAAGFLAVAAIINAVAKLT